MVSLIFDVDLSNFNSYAINLCHVWLLAVIFNAIAVMNQNLYYLLLMLMTTHFVFDRWNEARNTYFNLADRLIDVANVLWVFGHALTHINTCYTTELMRSNMWVDIIVHHISAVLTLAAYYYRHRKQKETAYSVSRREYAWTLNYLTFVAMYSFFSIYVSIQYVHTPDDGDRLALWWIGAGLSFVNFSTVNIYGQDIFSKRFLVELLHGTLVFLVQVSGLVTVQTFVSTHYFETYLFGALLYRKYSYMDRWIGSKLPGSPFRMNFLLSKMFFKPNYELIDVLRDYVAKYSGTKGICQSMSGLRRLVIITDGQVISHVLANPSIYEQGTPVRNASKIAGDNAFPKFVGKEYHKHKQHFQAFKLAELARSHITENLGICVDTLVEKWRDVESFEYLDEKTLWPNLHRLMFDIFGRTMIGYDYGSINGVSSADQITDMTKLRPAALYYLNLLVKAAQTQFPFPIYLFYHRYLNQKYRQARKTMQTHCREVVKRYRVDSGEFEMMNVKPILYQIVQDMNNCQKKDQLTNDELVDDISDLLAAGTDSISTVLSWAIFYLSKEPYIQEKLRQELKEKNLHKEKQITFDQLESCEYLRRFVKELLRHAPINVPLQRTAVKDDILQGFKIYPGDELMLLARDVSQNDIYWDNSRTFDPDRPEWMREKNDNIKHLLTFGGGARACPGRNFSQLQLRALIALLLLRIEFCDTPGNLGGETSMLEGVVKPKTVRIKINYL